MYTYFDGLTGERVVTMTLAQAQQCSHVGQCILDIREVLPRVVWHVNEQQIRRLLLDTGAWDISELSILTTNKERLLWVAACSIREDPPMYKD